MFTTSTVCKVGSLKQNVICFPELHEKWEARRAEERARQEAERAERERKAKEEAERKAAEEAKRKEEEERLRREQAEEAGEGEEAGDKEGGEEAGEGKEVEEKAKEEEGEEEEGAAAAEAKLKDVDTPELQPSGEDLSLGGGPEEEELVLDTDMPPNTPETEEFRNNRVNFERDFPQLLSVLKGTNNIEPISVSVEKEADKLNKEIIKKIEGEHVGTRLAKLAEETAQKKKRKV